MALTAQQRREGSRRALTARDSLSDFLHSGQVPDAAATSEPIADAVVMDIDKIFPTPPGQAGWKVAPRRKADHDKHLELKRQIQEGVARNLGINGTGIWQPIVVRRTDDPERFYITAGARRWRAAKEAGLMKIPVIVRDQKTVEAFETALVENLLREDFTVADAAHALQQWMQEADISLREMARRTGKSHSAISTAIGTTKDPVLSKAIEDGKITPSQAREMLSAPAPSRKKLVDSVATRRAAGVSVPLSKLREEVKAEIPPRPEPEEKAGGTLRTKPSTAATTTTPPVVTPSMLAQRRAAALQDIKTANSLMANAAAELLALRLETGKFDAEYRKAIRDEVKFTGRQQESIIAALEGKKAGEA